MGRSSPRPIRRASIAAPHSGSSMGTTDDDPWGRAEQEIHLMSRVFAAILIVALLAVGGGVIATTAYQAGAAANVTVVQAGTDAANGAVVAPVVVPAYGW